MAKVRQGGADKWVNRAAVAADDYRQGVSNPRRDWASATEAGSENWKAGIQKAAQNNTFAKGVKKAGNSKWLRGAVDKGAARYPQGVAAGKADYEKGIAPFIQTIEQTDLGPRYPRGDPRNIQRVQKMAAALHAKKNEIKNQ